MLLAAVRVLPFDLEAARQSAGLRATMEALGTPLGPMDTLIAGVALAQRATLVTNNTREFRRVPALKLDNWIRLPFRLIEGACPHTTWMT